MKVFKYILSLLESPVVIIVGILAGFVIGFYFENIAGMMAPLGKMYLAFLNMCILPIIITSVISGLAKLIRTPEAGKRFPKIIIGFVIMLFIPSIVGTVAALVGKPGKNLGDAELEGIGNFMAQAPPVNSGSPEGFVDLIVGIVPWNIFESLSRGDIMSIVFTCMLIGIGAGVTKNKAVDDMVAIIDALSDVFNQLFKWVINFLPIGVCCVIADQMTGFSPAILGIMLNYIVMAYLTVVLLILLYMVIMWRVVGGSFRRCFTAMKDSLFLSFTVDSSFIAIKPSLDSLEEILGVERKISSLVIPFAMVANRQGKIFIFAFTSIFLAQLYGAELEGSEYAAVIIGSSLAGMAAPGSGVLLASMAAVVINSIGVPSALAFVIFTINGPIVDRILSTLTVQGSCLLAALSTENSNKQKLQDRQ